MSPPSLIDWQDGQPISRLYGDVFFSRLSGIEETRYVFLARNHLAERWAALQSANFIIGETGFGTGLNFLCAWQLWEKCRPAQGWLHFFSIEKHPLSLNELHDALALWPQLAVQRDALLAQYCDPAPGWHRFVFAQSRITLTLAIDEVENALTQLDVQADAWFLDGFSPASNPDMWSAPVLKQIAAHTKPSGSFATYTAAGEVRRTLQAAGFEVERVPGHGIKREMLCGILAEAMPQEKSKPWFNRPHASSDQRAIVIGGGLAGASAAASLAARGWQIDLLDRHDSLAAEASGNAQAILYARLSGHATALRDFVIAGYAYSIRSLSYQPCGVLQLAFNEDEAKRQAQLLTQALPFFRKVDAREASELCGVEVPHEGLWFEQGGWAHPPAICASLCEHPNIRVHLHRAALALQKTDNEWRVMNGEQCVASAPVVILAGARDSAMFAQSAYLPLTPIRGQITALPATPASAALNAVVCGEGYIAPTLNGTHTLGATHKFHDASTDLRADEHTENLTTLATLLPSLDIRTDVAKLEGRAALRISTPDYLPLVGPLVDANAFKIAYAALSHDARLPLDNAAPWHAGLYVSTGHGSRGLISAPLAGELLAAYLSGEPSPLPKTVMDAIHPSRFLLRNLIRGQPCS